MHKNLIPLSPILRILANSLSLAIKNLKFTGRQQGMDPKLNSLSHFK